MCDGQRPYQLMLGVAAWMHPHYSTAAAAGGGGGVVIVGTVGGAGGGVGGVEGGSGVCYVMLCYVNM